jgi:hypothetical protein
MYSKAFLVLVTLLLNQVKPNFGTALETPKNHGRWSVPVDLGPATGVIVHRVSNGSSTTVSWAWVMVRVTMITIWFQVHESEQLAYVLFRTWVDLVRSLQDGWFQAEVTSFCTVSSIKMCLIQVLLPEQDTCSQELGSTLQPAAVTIVLCPRCYHTTIRSCTSGHCE